MALPKDKTKIQVFKWAYILAIFGAAMVKLLFPFQGKSFFPEWFGTTVAAIEAVLALMLMTRFSRCAAFLLVLFFLAAGVFSWKNPGVRCGCFGSFQAGQSFHEIIISLMGIGAILFFLFSDSRKRIKASH